MPSKKLSGSQLKKFRSDVAKLKAKGLLSPRIDARKQKPTRYMQGRVAEFQDVLEGRAKVVKVPKRKGVKKRDDYERLRETFRVTRGHVVVPANTKANVSISRKTGEVTKTERINGRKVKSTFRGQGFEATIKAPRGKNVLYRIEFGGGQKMTFDNYDDLVAFMHPYETKVINPFKEWQKYVEVVSIEDGEAGE